MLSKACNNCAHACIVNPVEKSLKNTRFCTYWVETVEETHACIKFKTHEKAGFCHLQNKQSKRIQRHSYPLPQISKISAVL